MRLLKDFLRRIRGYFIRHKVVPVKISIQEGNLLSGKTCLVIGGTGGIGMGVVERFVQNGANVIVAGTNSQLITGIEEKYRGKAKGIVLNVKSVDEFRSKIEECHSFYGNISVFVYSAGVHCHDSFGSIAEATWDNVMDINLKGMYFACQEVSNYMIRNRIQGHILTIGSASCAKPGWTPYEISKAAVRSLTLGFADKLIKYGIVVNSIAPGPVATKMLNRTDDSDLTWMGSPVGRMATVEEIAEMALQLASSTGDLVVGDTLFVSGGSGLISNL